MRTRAIPAKRFASQIVCGCPRYGEVVIAGKPASEWDAVRLRRRIGYVMQDVGLFPHFTVERNIALVPSLEGWPPDRIARRVSELLEKLGWPAGLGDFIYRGLQTVNSGLILLGAVPAALMALAADYGLGVVEKRLSRG